MPTYMQFIYVSTIKMSVWKAVKFEKISICFDHLVKVPLILRR